MRFSCETGVQDTKLEIHGCDGQSYHAVLQTRFCIDDGFPATLEQQMVEYVSILLPPLSEVR